MRAPRRLPAFQAQAQSMMTLTFTAYKVTGTTTDGDGYKVPTYTSQGSTAGKIQASTTRGGDTATRTANVGGVERPVLEAGLHIPVSAAVPAAGEYHIGWEYLCTAVGPNDDPALLHKRYLVVGTPTKSFATARRLDVVEVPKP